MDIRQSLYFTYQRFRTKGVHGLVRFLRLKATGLFTPDFFSANARAHAATQPTRGITFIADLCGRDSIAKTARDFVRALHDSGLPFQAFDPHFTGDPAGTSIDELITARSDFDLRRYSTVIEMFEGAVSDRLCVRHVSIPFWEFESGFPEIHPALARRACIAGMSDFNVDYFRRALPSARVMKILYPLQVPHVDPATLPATRARYGLAPDDFVVFFNFSYLSGYHRKNPESALEAFAAAFADVPRAKLVFKTVHAAHFPREAARVRALAHVRGLDGRFITLDDYVPAADLLALTAACDCYLSLHRGEGFGLGVAEAMALGRPAVVTDYGATREFCTPETACPVPYRLVPVHPAQIDNSHYTFVSAWAEPDVAAAACALRELYANPELRAARGEAARAFIARHFSRENFRASLETLLNET